MVMNKTVCDSCGVEVPGRNPKGWGSLWVFFNETEEIKQLDVMLDLCSIECIAKLSSRVKARLNARIARKGR